MSEEKTSKLAPVARSPAYPYIPLDIALERVKRIYAEIRDHAQPREVLAKAYGKPATSSGTIQTFATLLQYGLLENASGSTGRRMKVSALSQGILNPHAPTDKVLQGLRTAALNPPVFSELWARFGDTSGLNESVPLYYLTEERGHGNGSVFTDKAARELLRIYRTTLAFAGVSSSTLKAQTAAAEQNDSVNLIDVKVGDLVQVEINGAFQFKEPKRVVDIKEYDGRFWAFVEGENSGIELEKVVVQNSSSNALPSAPPQREVVQERGSLGEVWSEERLLDDQGEEIYIRYKGKASVQRYEFIRDYLDFKIKRLSKTASE